MFDDFKNSFAGSAVYAYKERTIRQKRAFALREIGETEAKRILISYGEESLLDTPLLILMKMARNGELRNEAMSSSILALPWGYRDTRVLGVGEYSDSRQPIFEYQDTPLLQSRTGRRARLAAKIKGLDIAGLRYCVVTSPALVPLYGDLGSALDEHLKRVRDIIKEAAGNGFTFIVRTTELVVSASGVNLHSNLLFKGNDSFPLSKVTQIAEAKCSETVVYGLERLANYMVKAPIKIDGEDDSDTFLSEDLYEYKETDVYDTDGMSNVFSSKPIKEKYLLDNRKFKNVLLPRLTILSWLHFALAGRRLIETGRNVDWSAMKEQEPANGNDIEYTCDYDEMMEKIGHYVYNPDSGPEPPVLIVQKPVAEVGEKTKPATENDSNPKKVYAKSTRTHVPHINRSVNAMIENEILRVTKPKISAAGYYEPLIMVKNFTETPKTEQGKENLAKIRSMQAEYRASLTKEERERMEQMRKQNLRRAAA